MNSLHTKGMTVSLKLEDWCTSTLHATNISAKLLHGAGFFDGELPGNCHGVLLRRRHAGVCGQAQWLA